MTISRPTFVIQSLSVLLIVFNVGISICQPSEIAPVQFHQIYQNYSLIHPAASGMETAFHGFVAYSALTSPFQGVNTSFAALTASTKSQEETDKNFHGFGSNLISGREGPYFTRNRLYASYAWHNQLNETWTLSGGAMLGIINYNYKGTDVYPGGTSTKPSADVGIMLYSPFKTHIGLTVNQIIPNDMSPLESMLRIKPYVSFSIDKKFELSPQISLKPILLVKTPIRKQVEWELTTFIILQDIVHIGASYLKENGFRIIAGAETFKTETFDIRFFASYYTPFGNKSFHNTSQLEFSVAFFKRHSH